MTDPFASFRLDGRVAIVTGASSGLGSRFAAVLHAAGATVVAAARRADRLEELTASLPGTVAVPTDVVDDDARRRLVEGTVERHGRIDILVNNAGISAEGDASSESLEDIERVVAVNQVAVHRLAQLTGNAMIAAGTGGAIVNIASMFGLIGCGKRAHTASYSATKGAVVNLTRELAAAWGPNGVRVNAIAPGYFPTEMTDDVIEDEKFVTWVQRQTPLRRLGEPHELDGALLFLASDASTYVTGQTVVVDGGWTAW